MSITRVRRQLQEKLDTRKPILHFFHAYLGDGQGNVVIDEDEPNYVWAREQGRGVVHKVYNTRVPNLNNLPVIVGLLDSTPYRWEVISIRQSDLDIQIGAGIIPPGSAEGVGPHHWQHEFRRDGTPAGSDVVWVNIQQVTDGLVCPSNPSSMTVQIYKCWYAYGQSFQFLDTTTADLSPYPPPGGGTARWILVSIDADTNTIQYTTGTTFPSALFPADEADTIPDAPIGSVPLAAIYVEDTTTEITWDNIYDMRLFPFGVSGTTTPTGHRLLEADVHIDAADNVVSTGDLIFGNGIYPEWDVLTVGSDGQILLSDGTHPYWGDMPSNSGETELVFSQIVDQVVEDTTAETTLFSSGRGSRIIDAGELDAGSVIRLTMNGHISADSLPDIKIDILLGVHAVGTTGLISIGNGMYTSIYESGWRLEVEIVIRTTGSLYTGNVLCRGIFEYEEGDKIHDVHSVSTDADTTVDMEIDATAEWSVADAANSITVEQAIIEILKADQLAVAAPIELEATEI